MSFWTSLFVTLLMGAVLSTSVVLLVAGKPLMILVSMVLFLIAFIKWGCLAH